MNQLLAKSKSFPHLQQGFSWVPTPTFSPPGKQLASACWDGVARIYDLENGVEPMELRGHTGGDRGHSVPNSTEPLVFFTHFAASSIPSLRFLYVVISPVWVVILFIYCYISLSVVISPGGFCTKSTMLRRMSAPPQVASMRHLGSAGYSSGVNYIIIIS